MILAAPAKAGLFNLLAESFRDLGRYKKTALVFPLLLAAASIALDLMHGQSESAKSSNSVFSVLHILIMFYWLKTLNGEMENRSKTVSKGMGRFGLYALAGFLILVVGVIIGLLAVSFLLPSMDSQDPARITVGAALGLLVMAPLLIKFAFVYPAAAFTEKTSFAMSWRQTRGWFWRLAGGFTLLFLGVLVIFGVMILLFTLLGDTPPVLIGVGAFSAFTGGLFDLLIAGFTAHAYRAAVGIPALEAPQG